MAKITDEENAAHKRERLALRALLESEGWRVLIAHVATLEKAHVQGMATPGASLETIKTHAGGYHDAVTLPTWPAERIAHLDTQIARHLDGK